MIIPKILDKLYMLTQGNILYLIIDVGYKTIEPRKATIRTTRFRNGTRSGKLIHEIRIRNTISHRQYQK